MSSFPSALALGAGGAGLSALGGVLGARSTNRAARQARDYDSRRQEAGSNRFGQTLLGRGFSTGNLASWNLASGENAGGVGGQSGMDAYLDSIGGSVLDQQRGLADAVSARQTGNLAFYDRDTARLTAGDNAYASNVDRLSRDAIDAAGAGLGVIDDYAQGADELIQTSSANRLRGMNRATAASLNARGLGTTTLVGNQQAANTARVGEDADRARLGVRQGVVDRRLGVLGQRAGMVANRAGMAAGVGGNLRSRDSQRSTGRQLLEESNLNRDVRLREAPINTIAQTVASPVTNPYLNNNSLGYFPGVSGAGSALSGVGNAAAQVGSLALYRQLYPELFS